MDEMPVLHQQDDSKLLPLQESMPLLEPEDANLIFLPHGEGIVSVLEEVKELQPFEDNLIPLCNRKQNVKNRPISKTEDKVEIIPPTQYAQLLASHLEDREQNTILHEKQEVETMVPPKKIKLPVIEKTVSNDSDKVLWKISGYHSHGLPVVLQKHMKWFKVLLLNRFGTQQANYSFNPTFADYVLLVKIEGSVGRIFNRHKKEPDVGFTTEYIFSQIIGNYAADVCHLQDMLTRSPLFLYDSTNGLWKKQFTNNGSSSFRNQEFHWQGIMCMRQVWTCPRSSPATQVGKVACLEAVISKSVMTDLQIVQEISCNLHIPWCHEVLDAVKRVLVLSPSFCVLENEKDVEHNYKPTFSKTCKAFSPASVNSTKVTYLKKRKKKGEPKKQNFPETINIANSLCSGTPVFPDLTSTFQITALPPLIDDTKQIEHVSSLQPDFTYECQSKPVKKMKKFNMKSKAPITNKKKNPQVVYRRGINPGVDREHYVVPLQQGWVREVVFRAVSENSRCDIYYHPPSGRKLRSGVDIRKYLEKENVQDLTIANFTFFPFVLGFGPPQEICRNAKLGITAFGKKHSNSDNEFKIEDMNISSSTATTESCVLKNTKIVSSPPAVTSANLKPKKVMNSPKAVKLANQKPKKIVSSPQAVKSTNLLARDGGSKHTLKENDGFEVTNEVGETTGYEDWIPQGNVLKNKHHGDRSVTTTDDRNKTPLMNFQSNSEKYISSEKEILDELCKEKQISDFEFEMATRELECELQNEGKLKMKIIKKKKKHPLYTRPKKALAKSVSSDSSLRSENCRYSKSDKFISRKKDKIKNIISKEPTSNLSTVTPVLESDQQCLSRTNSEYNREILGLALNTTQSSVCNSEINNAQSEICNLERKNTQSQVCNSDSLSDKYTMDSHENIVIKSEENLYDTCDFKQELHSVSENHNGENTCEHPSNMYPIDIKCEPLFNTSFDNNDDGIDLNMLRFTPDREHSLEFSSKCVNNYEETDIPILDSNSHKEDIRDTFQDRSLPVISQIQSGKEVEQLFEEPLRLWHTAPVTNSRKHNKPQHIPEAIVQQPVSLQSSNKSTSTAPLRSVVTSHAQESPVAEDAVQRKLQENPLETLSKMKDNHCSSVIGIKNKIIGTIQNNVAVYYEDISNNESLKTFRKLTTDKIPKGKSEEIHIPQNQEIMLSEKVSNLPTKLNGSVEQGNRMSQPSLHTQASASKQINNLPVQLGQIQPHHLTTGQANNTLRTFRKLNEKTPETTLLNSKMNFVPLQDSNIKSQPHTSSGQINNSLRKFRILTKNKTLTLQKGSIEQANNFASQEKDMPTQPSKSSEHVINLGSQQKNMLKQPSTLNEQVISLESQQKDMVTLPSTPSGQIIQTLTSPKGDTAQLLTSSEQVKFTLQQRNIAQLSTSNEQVINSVSQQKNMPTQSSPSIRQSYLAVQKRSLPIQPSCVQINAPQQQDEPIISSISKKKYIKIQPKCGQINAPQIQQKITPTYQSTLKEQISTIATQQLESIPRQPSSKKVLNVTFVSTSIEQIKSLIIQKGCLPVQLDNGQTMNLTFDQKKLKSLLISNGQAVDLASHVMNMTSQPLTSSEQINTTLKKHNSKSKSKPPRPAHCNNIETPAQSASEGTHNLIS